MGGLAQRLDGQTLKLARLKDLRNYPMRPADAPLIPALVDLLG
jgi:8-oxo-dGTP diphosphatase